MSITLIADTYGKQGARVRDEHFPAADDLQYMSAEDYYWRMAVPQYDINVYKSKSGGMLPILRLWTDGSYRSSDKSCGIGIYYGNEWSTIKMSRDDYHEPFNNGKRTNIRAELYAIQKALSQIELEILGETMKPPFIVEIHVDCKFAYQALRLDLRSEQNNDIIAPTVALIEGLMHKYDLVISFTHVKSHKTAPSDTTSKEWIDWYGNSQADRLANMGADISV